MHHVVSCGDTSGPSRTRVICVTGHDSQSLHADTVIQNSRNKMSRTDIDAHIPRRASSPVVAFGVASAALMACGFSGPPGICLGIAHAEQQNDVEGVDLAQPEEGDKDDRVDEGVELLKHHLEPEIAFHVVGTHNHNRVHFLDKQRGGAIRNGERLEVAEHQELGSRGCLRDIHCGMTEERVHERGEILH